MSLLNEEDSSALVTQLFSPQGGQDGVPGTTSTDADLVRNLFGASGANDPDYAAPTQGTDDNLAYVRQFFGDTSPQQGATETTVQPSTTATGAALRGAAQGVGPAAAAAAAFEPGAAAGAAIGAAIPGLDFTGIPEVAGGVIGGVVSSALAAGGAAWAQHKAAQAIAPGATQKLDELAAADQAQHPVASAVGSIASALPVFELNPGQSVRGVSALWKAARGIALNDAEKEAAKATAAQVGLGTGTAVVQPLLFGQSPTKQGIAEAFVQSLILGNPRIHVLGKPQIDAITQEEQAKDEAAAKENPVENPETNYGAVPPPTLTPEQRAQLSALAFKAATGAKIEPEDQLVHKLMLDNDDARKEFNQQKQAWGQAISAELATQAQAKAQETGFDLQNWKPPQQPTLPEGAAATGATPQATSPPAQGGAVPGGGIAEKRPEAIAPADQAQPGSKQTPAAVSAPATTPATPATAPTLITQRFRRNPFQGDPAKLIATVKASSAPAIEQSDAGAGIRAGQLYAEIKPDSDPLSPGVLSTLFKGARADADSRIASKKRVVMLSPDGTHVMVSTPGEVQRTTAAGTKLWVKSVASYEGDKVVNKPYSDLYHEGWKPLAAIKTDVTAKSLVETYSLRQWNEIRASIHDTVADRIQKAETGVEPVSEKAATDIVGSPESDAGQGGHISSTPNAPTFQAYPQAKAVEFARGDAEHLESIIGQKNWESNREGLHRINEALMGANPDVLRRVLDQISPRDANSNDVDYQVGYERLQNHILKIYENSKTKSVAEQLRQYRVPSTRAGDQSGGNPGASKTGHSSAKETPDDDRAGNDRTPANEINAGRSKRVGGEAAAEGAQRAEKDAGQNPSATGKPAAGGTAAGVGPKIEAVSAIQGLPKRELQKVQEIAAKIATESGDNLDPWELRRDRESRVRFLDEKARVLQESRVVKVDGHAALLHAGIIHDQDGNQIKAPPGLYDEVAKKRTAQAAEEVRRLMPTAARTGDVADAAIRGLRAIGIRVDRIIDPLAKHFATGEYKTLLSGSGKAQDVITWHVADAQNPTPENLTALFHEAGHAVFARLSPEIQAAALRAIGRFTDTALGIEGYKEEVPSAASILDRPWIEQEGRLVESLARKLVGEGFNPADAKGWAQRIWQIVSDVAHAVYLGIMKYARYPMDDRLALKYFQHRLQAAMRGEKPMALVNWLGGPRLKLPDWDDPQATRRFAGINPMTNPRRFLDTKEGAPVGIAVLNHYLQVGRDIVKQWDLTGNTAGLTDDQVFRQFFKLPEKVGGSDMFVNGATPGSLIAEATKIHGVNPNTRIEDLPSDLGQRLAKAVTHRMLSETCVTMKGFSDEARADWQRGVNQLDQNNSQLVRLSKDFVDFDHISTLARESMLDLLQDEGRVVRGVRDFAGNEGAIGQVLRQLDSSIKEGTLPKQYADALNTVHRILVDPRFADDEHVNLTAILDHLTRQDIDWKQPTSILKDALFDKAKIGNDENLLPLFRDNAKSRALLATVISWAKSNDHQVALLQERLDKNAAERAKVGPALKQMLDASERNLGSLRKLVIDIFKDLRTRDRMVRVADKIAELRKANYDLMAANERNKARVDFYEDAFRPTTNDRMNALERDLGISLQNFEVYHGASVSVPTGRDTAPDKFMSKKLSLRTDVGKKGQRPTPTPEVRSWMNSMHDWVGNADNRRYGAKYNEVMEALQKLTNHFVGDMHENIKSNFLLRFLEPIQEKANSAGTPAARQVGIAFNKYQSSYRVKQADGYEFGTRNEAALASAMREFPAYHNADSMTFWRNVISPALNNLAVNKERYLSIAHYEDRLNAEIRDTLAYLQLRDPRQRATVERLLRQQAFNSRDTVANGAKLKNKILDTDPTYTIFRPVLGESLTTMPRLLTERAQELWRNHMAGWAVPLNKEQVARAYDTDHALLSSLLADKFESPQVWEEFMRHLAYNERSFFYAPSDGGLAPLADRQAVINAYEGARGDVVKFAELLAAAHGVRADGAFVGETLDTVQNFANLLRAMVGGEAEAVTRGSPAPKRFIMDARHIEAAPKEWMEYTFLDRRNLERIYRAQSWAYAFGRGGAELNKNLTTAINEQSAASTTYSDWRKDFLRENPGLSEAKLQKLIRERAEQHGVSYDNLKNARGRRAALEDVRDSYKNLQQLNSSGKIPELAPWTRLLHTMAGWTVSGAGTAITAHSVSWEQPVRLMGLGTRSLKMTVEQTLNLGKVMGNSLAQAFGKGILFETEGMLNAQQSGLRQVLNTNEERMLSAFRHTYASSGPVGRAVGKVADAGMAALQADVFAPGARKAALARQAAGGAVAPTVTPLSPFQWVAKCLEISNFITWSNHIKKMVAAGVAHLDEHPELVDDPKFKLDRKILAAHGFEAGDREFKFLENQLAGYGLSFDQMVRDAYRARGSGKPILSDEAIRNIGAMTLNQITLESSLTSRKPFLQTRGLGVAMNPFLGWPLQKTYQVFRQLREPNGEATQKAFRNGLLAYAAILPIGMVFAWLRDEFDENALGRKQRTSDLSTIRDPKSALFTALDNASRVGTFGLIGDFPNQFLSDDNVRPLSLDSRVFFVSQLESLYSTVRALYNQTAPQIARGNLAGAEASATDYETVLRPFVQSFGGNGLLQNLGALNHLLGADDAEARVNNRISVNNYLRVAGRELGLDVRGFEGMVQGQTAPNPIKPFVGQMVLAAYANDRDDFASAFKMAQAQALDELRANRGTGQPEPTKEDAKKRVISMYDAQNPLKIVFKGLTQQDYYKVLAQLPENGKVATQQALRLYQHYANEIGANADLFPKQRNAAADNFLADMGRPLTFDSMRAAATQYGRHSWP